jgi:hypothetical protein
MAIAGVRFSAKRARKILSDPKYGKQSKRAAERALKLLRATPKWLSDKDKAQMRRIYIDAKQRGLTVDHIVPVSSFLVCGLHVPWNITAISAERNTQKSNTFWPDCPFEQSGLDFQPIQRELIFG